MSTITKKNGSATKTKNDEQFIDLQGQVEAINRSQAVIEFDLDGTILTANDTFLNAVGYTLGEVEGQHHSMFVDAEYARSREYKQFWTALHRGEYHTDEFKQLGKGGKEVWIQASYNPILDANDEPFKVVKYATDITEQVKTKERLQESMERIAETAQQLASSSEEMSATSAQMGSNAEETSAQASAVASAAEQVDANVQTVATGAEERAASIKEVASNANQTASPARPSRPPRRRT